MENYAIVLTIVLAAAVVGLFIASGKRDRQKYSARPSDLPSENKKTGSGGLCGMPNPIRELSTAEEVNEAVGCKIKKLPDAEDERFSIITTEPVLGQYDFTYGGARYTLRASRTEGDITGVYVSGGTLTDTLTSREVGPTEIEGCRFMRFFRGDMQYTLYSPDAELASFAIVGEKLSGMTE